MKVKEIVEYSCIAYCKKNTGKLHFSKRCDMLINKGFRGCNTNYDNLFYKRIFMSKR